jgi:hypothetical protein
MRMTAFSMVLQTLVLAACAAEDLPLRAGSVARPLQGFERPGRLPLDADLSAPPSGGIGFWIMGDEWREDVDPPLYRGADAELSVWPERLPRCAAGGAVLGFLSPDVGDLIEVELLPSPHGGPLRGRFVVPDRARELEIWIRAEGPDGCVEWDSDYGRNYRLPVHVWSPTLVRFEADWSEWAEGPLVAGSVFAVAYDHARLPECRIVYRGFPSWEIIAHAALDGIPVPGHSVVLSTPGGTGSGDREPALALFPIPWDARVVELWFENRQYPPTCHAWDSDYGRNYRFSVQESHSVE